MKRIVLVHWNTGEAETRAASLRKAGFGVEPCRPAGAAGLVAATANPPDAFVIDLSGMPSHGRAVAAFLRQRKATRHVPLVFAGGEPEKVAAARKMLPDAGYANWSRIRGVLREAMSRRPVQPVVPDTMAGYSGTPLPKKLGIKTGMTVALLGAPEGFEGALGELPEGVRLQAQPRGAAWMLLFVRTAADLGRRFPAAERALPEKGGLWICWPKKASGLASDLSEPAVRAFGLERALVDYKICAIDHTWSGLLFARRKAR
jgi:hypothetical protein